MARDIQINGECLVRVIGDQSFPPLNQLVDLCLTDRGGRVVVSPKFYHRDVKADDFGPDAPAEVLAMMAEATVRMTAVHFDPDVLEACITKSLGGAAPGVAAGPATFGTLPGAGVLMGGGKGRLAPGTNFIGLNLTSPVLGRPWRFLTAYLVDPLEVPLGTTRTKVAMTWRAIPYVAPAPQNNVPGTTPVTGDVVAAGAVLWDRTSD